MTLICSPRPIRQVREPSPLTDRTMDKTLDRLDGCINGWKDRKKRFYKEYLCSSNNKIILFMFTFPRDLNCDVTAACTVM